MRPHGVSITRSRQRPKRIVERCSRALLALRRERDAQRGRDDSENGERRGDHFDPHAARVGRRRQGTMGRAPHRGRCVRRPRFVGRGHGESARPSGIPAERHRNRHEWSTRGNGARNRGHGGVRPRANRGERIVIVVVERARGDAPVLERATYGRALESTRLRCRGTRTRGGPRFHRAMAQRVSPRCVRQPNRIARRARTAPVRRALSRVEARSAGRWFRSRVGDALRRLQRKSPLAKKHSAHGAPHRRCCPGPSKHESAQRLQFHRIDARTLPHRATRRSVAAPELSGPDSPQRRPVEEPATHDEERTERYGRQRLRDVT